VFGARVAGQVGKQDVGLLHVRTDEAVSLAGDVVPSEDFSILRIKRRVLAQSYLGALVTRRDPKVGSTVSNTFGLDMLLATSTFRGSQNLELGAFALGASNRPGRTGENLAYGINLNYPNDPWEASFDFREVQENFDPAVGDVSRTDYRRFSPEIKWSPRLEDNRWIRNFAFGGAFEVLTDRTNKLLSRNFDLTVFEVEMNSQDTFRIIVKPEYQWLRPTEGNRISGISLPVDSKYSFTRYETRISTASRRMFAVTATTEQGPFYSGRRQEYSLSLNVRVRPGLILYNTFEYNKINLAEGRTQTRLFRFTPEWQLSPWMAFVNNFQYDSVSRVLGWQSRFRWILQPGNDLYFVYTHNWIDCVGPDGPGACTDFSLPDGRSTLERRVSTKFVYTHRF
jgi:hypothetical protein